MKKIILLIFFTAFFGSLFFIFAKNTNSKNEFSFTGEFKKDELLVKFKDEEKGKASLYLLDHFSKAQSKKITRKGVYKVKVPQGRTIEEFYQEIKKDSNIQYAEPNYIVKIVATPNDTYYAQQWALPKISAPQAWDVTTGSSNTKLAVIDTGIDYAHEDLSSKVWTNPSEINSNSIDDDNNGYVDDYQGFDFCGTQQLVDAPPYGWVYVCLGDTYNSGTGKWENDADSATDDHAHGTSVAGIAAAASNNNKVVAGIDWNAKIVPLKVLSQDGFGSVDTISEGIDYVANNSIPIASMSLGTYSFSQTLKDSVDSAYLSGAVIAAAAGNDDLNQIIYPAKFSNVLAVGATDSSDQRITTAVYGWGSNYGEELDVMAPGTGLYSTDITGAGGYSSGNYTTGFGGTSGATPHVSGELALIKAVAPLKTNAELMDIARNSADKVSGMGGQNFTNYYGYGRINLDKALTNYQWQFISQGSDKNLVGLSPGETAVITLTAKNIGTTTWQRIGSNPTRVGASHPQDRSSPFADGSWLGPNRPVGIPNGTDTVAPGEQVTFSWNYRAPGVPGTYYEHFSLLLEGITWMNDPGVNYYTVVNGSYSWQFISQASDKNLAGLSPSETATITLTAKNIGNTTWLRTGSYPVRVGTTHPQDRMSSFNDGTWSGSNRPVGIPNGTDTVAPGEQVTFSWNYRAPASAGIYTEHFSLLAEGITWMNDPGVNYYTVVNGSYSWQFISQASDKNLQGLSPGESATITLTAKNTGNTTWFRTGSYPVRVGTTHPQDRMSSFNDGTWLGSNRPVGIPGGTNTVASGEQTTFSWTIVAPGTPNIYTEHFSLLAEGITWMNDPWVNYYIIVGGAATLEGVPLPAYSGKTAWEQHLALSGYQEPAATHYTISGTPAPAQNGMAWETSGGSGYGAWGVAPPTDDERYYICMRWNYTNLHGQPIYAPKNWYYKKRVLVINPANNKKVIASIIEYGPSPSTGRVPGLSPEAMIALSAVTDDNLIYYWSLDQNLPLGPII